MAEWGKTFNGSGVRNCEEQDLDDGVIRLVWCGEGLRFSRAPRPSCQAFKTAFDLGGSFGDNDEWSVGDPEDGVICLLSNLCHTGPG